MTVCSMPCLAGSTMSHMGHACGPLQRLCQWHTLQWPLAAPKGGSCWVWCSQQSKGVWERPPAWQCVPFLTAAQQSHSGPAAQALQVGLCSSFGACRLPPREREGSACHTDVPSTPCVSSRGYFEGDALMQLDEADIAFLLMALTSTTRMVIR